ncbi:hypothetical protein [Bacillus kwashiorkori]|uniref:hypothetical protein n=1 Tax=Bacillus kwashiorkori TaxID=1522318 RepID=UPI000783C21C|nr:hypothetical protein [Bacillus kwashiorkori]
MRGLLIRSILKGEKLEMIYQSEKGVLSQRIIQVRKVSENHFIAFCHTKKQIRTFKFSNVLSIAPLKKTYRTGA